MSAFTHTEIAILQSQFLGRLATVGSGGQPHVVPVGFRYNPEYDTLDIGGYDFASRKKFRDVRRNPHVAFVVDDVASVTPWRVRGIEIRGKPRYWRRPARASSLGLMRRCSEYGRGESLVGAWRAKPSRPTLTLRMT